MTEDKRGVLRGECLEENCDCALYEREDSLGMKCCYCDHGPGRHLAMTIVGSSELPCAELNGNNYLVLDPRGIIMSSETDQEKGDGKSDTDTAQEAGAADSSRDKEVGVHPPDVFFVKGKGNEVADSSPSATSDGSIYEPQSNISSGSTSSEESHATAARPLSSSEGPTTKTMQPSPSSKELPSKKAQPSPSSAQLPAKKAQPSPSSEEPSAKEARPSTSSEEPSAKEARPSTSSVEPPAKKARSETKKKPSAKVKKTILNPEEIIACVPEILPPAIASALDPEQKDVTLTNAQRCILVRDLASRLHAKGFKQKAEVDIATEEAVKRWGSPIKSPLGASNSALTKSVMERISKLNRPSFGGAKRTLNKNNNSSKTPEDDKESHDEAVASMTEEMRKPRPSLPVLKGLLATTRKIRRESIVGTPTSVTQILKLYPALKLQDMLLVEFEAIIGIPVCELKATWEECVKKLVRHCNGEKSCPNIDTSLPEDCQHIKVMENIHLIVKGGKKSTQRKRRVLEVFEPGTSMENSVPDKDDPPRLVAVGDTSVPNLNLTCYTDGQPLAVSGKPSEAVILLLAAYWVFDVQFPSDAKAPLLFISATCLGKKAPAAEVQKFTTVTNLLNKIRLMK